MELLRIGERKLKVTLSGEDMTHYRLDGETLDYDTTETRRAFWQILDDAKHETGFDAGGGKLFVQIYPSRGGGCEIYITLVEGVATEESEKEKEGLAREESVFSFESLPLLLSVCRKLSELGYCEESAVYAEGGAYYLMIRERHSQSLVSARALGEYSFIEEYGTRLPSGGAQLARLREHGRCLAPSDAVFRLAAL